MLVIGAYVVVEGVRAIVGGSHAEESALGVILATLSLLVLPWLGRRKLLVSVALVSGPLAATPSSRSVRPRSRR